MKIEITITLSEQDISIFSEAIDATVNPSLQHLRSEDEAALVKRLRQILIKRMATIKKTC